MVPSTLVHREDEVDCTLVPALIRFCQAPRRANRCRPDAVLHRNLNRLDINAFHHEEASALVVDRGLVNCDFPLFFFSRIVLLVFVNSELPITQVTQPVIVTIISVALRPTTVLIVMIIIVVMVVTSATTSIVEVIIVVAAAVVAVVVLVPAILVVTFAIDVWWPAAPTGTHRRCIKLGKVRIGMPTHGQAVETLHIERLARVVAVLRATTAEVRGLVLALLVIRLRVVIML